MKTIIAVLLACVFVVGFVGCSDDGGSSVDNVASCKEAAKKIGAISCGTVDMTTFEKALTDTCDNYKQTTCDIADFWKCYGDCYTCKDVAGTKTIDATKCTDCTKLATCK